MKKIIYITIGFLGFVTLVSAAPYFNFTRTMVPEADNQYDLGTTSLKYRNLYLSGTCTGCGGGGNSKWATSTIDSNSIFNVGLGAVGIGTTTPRWQLQVASTTAPQLTLTAGITDSHWTFRNAGGNLYIATSSPTTFATTTVPYFSMLSSGTIGIASTTPWGLLSVNPNALAAGTPQFVVGSSTRTNFIVDITDRVGVATTSPYALFSIEQVANTRPAFVISDLGTSTPQLIVQGNKVGIGSSTPTSHLSILGTTPSLSGAAAPNTLMVLGATGESTNNGNGGGIWLKGGTGGGGSGTPKSGGQIYIEGGTGSPSGSGFSVGATTTVIAGVGSGSSGSTYGPGGALVLGGGNAPSDANSTTMGGNAYLFGGTKGTLSRVHGNVIVGINPITGVQQGNLLIGSTATTSSRLYAIATSSIDNGLDLFRLDSAVGAGVATSTNFKVQQNGRTGVGTSSPWGLFSVNASSTNPFFVVGSSTATNFIIDNSGKIGIGTTTPTGTLSVQGASANSASKGTCFRAKDVGANTFTYWWYQAGVQVVSTINCGGVGTTTITYD